MGRTDRMLASARGECPADLVVKGARVANVLSLEYEDVDVAVTAGRIVGLGRGYRGEVTVEGAGKVLIPGMIDGHLHIESTMLAPGMFAAAVVPYGTTTVLPDPHEIANTCGLEGIAFMHRESQDVPLDMFFAAPSCVPASPFETPLEELGASDLLDCYDRGWCTHLGEVMNFPGVISGDSSIWGKIEVSRHYVKTAHAPGVSGADLCAYLLSGCDGDHESNETGEALEKLRRGMWVMMREGATEKNLEELAGILLEDESRFARCMVVSDDLSANYIMKNGHMDHKVRLMVRRGIRPLVALALVTVNPANYFRLWDRGALAPGRIADMALVDSLENCRVEAVWKRGVLVAEKGKPLFEPRVLSRHLPGKHKRVQIDGEKLRVYTTPVSEKKIRVIEVLPGSVLTKHLILTPTLAGGEIVADPERDIAKLVVVEKNRGTGRTAVGFVRGFGIRKGAIASSVAHDAHNFIAVGVDDRSIETALKYLAEHEGGMVAAEGETVRHAFALPIGGLMSPLDPCSVACELDRMEAVASEFGVLLPHPYMAMSFLSLSVIPELKLTDQGYVDLSQGGLLDVGAE